jgi:hypothetical protein
MGGEFAAPQPWWGVRLTRHAKNELRSLGIELADAERVVADPVRVDRDPEGKLRYTGYIRDVRVRVVVALDEPDLIITIHQRRR